MWWCYEVWGNFYSLCYYDFVTMKVSQRRAHLAFHILFCYIPHKWDHLHVCTQLSLHMHIPLACYLSGPWCTMKDLTRNDHLIFLNKSFFDVLWQCKILGTWFSKCTRSPNSPNHKLILLHGLNTQSSRLIPWEIYKKLNILKYCNSSNE